MFGSEDEGARIRHSVACFGYSSIGRESALVWFTNTLHTHIRKFSPFSHTQVKKNRADDATLKDLAQHGFVWSLLSGAVFT